MTEQPTPDAPGIFALLWVQAAGRRDIAHAWPVMTPEFRLSMVQYWITWNPAVLTDSRTCGLDRDALASKLAQPAPTHELFEQAAHVCLREITNSFGNLDVDDLGVGTRPRPVGPDTELVRLFYLPDLDRDPDGNYSFGDGASARSANVLLRRLPEAWTVVGIGEGLLHPGWPPTPERLVQPQD